MNLLRNKLSAEKIRNVQLPEGLSLMRVLCSPSAHLFFGATEDEVDSTSQNELAATRAFGGWATEEGSGEGS